MALRPSNPLHFTQLYSTQPGRRLKCQFVRRQETGGRGREEGGGKETDSMSPRVFRNVLHMRPDFSMIQCGLSICQNIDEGPDFIIGPCEA